MPYNPWESAPRNVATARDTFREGTQIDKEKNSDLKQLALMDMQRQQTLADQARQRALAAQDFVDAALQKDPFGTNLQVPEAHAGRVTWRARTFEELSTNGNRAAELENQIAHWSGLDKRPRKADPIGITLGADIPEMYRGPEAEARRLATSEIPAPAEEPLINPRQGMDEGPNDQVALSPTRTLEERTAAVRDTSVSSGVPGAMPLPLVQGTREEVDRELEYTGGRVQSYAGELARLQRQETQVNEEIARVKMSAQPGLASRDSIEKKLNPLEMKLDDLHEKIAASRKRLGGARERVGETAAGLVARGEQRSGSTTVVAPAIPPEPSTPTRQAIRASMDVPTSVFHRFPMEAKDAMAKIEGENVDETEGSMIREVVRRTLYAKIFAPELLSDPEFRSMLYSPNAWRARQMVGLQTGGLQNRLLGAQVTEAEAEVTPEAMAFKRQVRKLGAAAELAQKNLELELGRQGLRAGEAAFSAKATQEAVDLVKSVKASTDEFALRFGKDKANLNDLVDVGDAAVLYQTIDAQVKQFSGHRVPPAFRAALRALYGPAVAAALAREVAPADSPFENLLYNRAVLGTLENFGAGAVQMTDARALNYLEKVAKMIGLFEHEAPEQTPVTRAPGALTSGEAGSEIEGPF
jgi:hypothetical protein